MMDQRSTELLGVAAVINSLALTDYLDPHISEGDKEPSYDGYVYLGKKKSQGLRRVHVQVKGTNTSDMSNEYITHPVQISDLKSYLYNGGSIYFVVQVDENNAKKIYYADLLPVKINQLLEETEKGKKSVKKPVKSIKLKLFPTDKKDIIQIFTSFYANSKKQYSFTGVKLPSLEELKGQNIKNLELAVSGYGFNSSDPLDALFNKDNEFYYYVNFSDSLIPQPLKYFQINVEQASTNIDMPVLINGKKYYDKATFIRLQDKTVLKIGQSLSIEDFLEKGISTISYKPSDSLHHRSKDLSFMLNALEHQSFTIGDISFPLAPSEKDLKKFNVAEGKNYLEFLEKVIHVFNMLDVKEDILISSLTETDEKNLHILIDAFSDKKPIRFEKGNFSPTFNMKIGNINLALSAVPAGENSYVLYDFFKTKHESYFKNDDGEKYPISQYAILKRDDYIKLSNLNCEVLLSSFQDIKHNQHNYAMANNTLLELLAAYDKIGDSKICLLETAKAFAEWLIKETGIDLPDEIRKLNYFQVVKRERLLNQNEKECIHKILENDTAGSDILVGGYLLLGNQDMAEIHFKKLPKDIQQNLKNYPIYRFWNSLENGMN